MKHLKELKDILERVIEFYKLDPSPSLYNKIYTDCLTDVIYTINQLINSEIKMEKSKNTLNKK